MPFYVIKYNVFKIITVQLNIQMIQPALNATDIYRFHLLICIGAIIKYKSCLSISLSSSSVHPLWFHITWNMNLNVAGKFIRKLDNLISYFLLFCLFDLGQKWKIKDRWAVMFPWLVTMTTFTQDINLLLFLKHAIIELRHSGVLGIHLRYSNAHI